MLPVAKRMHWKPQPHACTARPNRPGPIRGTTGAGASTMTTTSISPASSCHRNRPGHPAPAMPVRASAHSSPMPMCNRFRPTRNRSSPAPRAGALRRNHRRAHLPPPLWVTKPHSPRRPTVSPLLSTTDTESGVRGTRPTARDEGGTPEERRFPRLLRAHHREKPQQRNAGAAALSAFRYTPDQAISRIRVSASLNTDPPA